MRAPLKRLSISSLVLGGALLVGSPAATQVHVSHGHGYGSQHRPTHVVTHNPSTRDLSIARYHDVQARVDRVASEIQFVGDRQADRHVQDARDHLRTAERVIRDSGRVTDLDRALASADASASQADQRISSVRSEVAREGRLARQEVDGAHRLDARDLRRGARRDLEQADRLLASGDRDFQMGYLTTARQSYADARAIATTLHTQAAQARAERERNERIEYEYALASQSAQSAIANAQRLIGSRSPIDATRYLLSALDHQSAGFAYVSRGQLSLATHSMNAATSDANAAARLANVSTSYTNVGSYTPTRSRRGGSNRDHRRSM